MSSSLNLKVEQQTALSLLVRKSLINWFNKQNIAIQIDIFAEQRNQFFKLKNTDKATVTLALSSFFLAINTFYQTDQLQKKKNKSINLDDMSNITNFVITKFKKQRYKEKREKILNIWSVIKKLKNENFSYRDISNYLLKRHKFDVSHTYIQKIWGEINND